jgi:hypothetical protein
MKPITSQQEILVLTSTEFPKRGHLKNDAATPVNNLHEKEKLKEDCRQGLLNDRLPEAFALADPNAEMYIFKMWDKKHFLLLEMGESFVEIESFYSINPYHFMPMKFFN